MIQLTRLDVARLAGVKPKTIDKYRARCNYDGTLVPEPDGYIGNKPWWDERRIERWLVTRRTGRGNLSKVSA